MFNVALVGASDGQLEALLRASGADVNAIEAAKLAKLAGAMVAQPDVIVLDLRRDNTIPAAATAVKRQHPDTAFIIVTATLDPALLVEAMRAGVTEVLNEPLAHADLDRALARVIGRRAASGASRIFGFIGAKGGVGTTTIAVNVATALGSMRRPVRTLIVDLHRHGGDAVLFFGVEPRFSIVDALENAHRLDETFFRGLVVEAAPGVDLLASSDRPVAAPLDATKLRALIDVAAGSYTFIVLDIPRNDPAVLDALDRAAVIAVVTSQELASVRSASRMLPMLKQRYGPNTVTLLLSRSDPHASIGQEDIEKAIDAEVAFSMPSDYRTAVHAVNVGRPLALDEKSELSAAYRRYASLLAGSRREPFETPRLGLLGRMTHAF